MPEMTLHEQNEEALFRVVGHACHSPLSAIIQVSHLITLDAEKDGNTPILKDMDEIRAYAAQAVSVTNTLLDFLRGEDGQCETAATDLAAVLQKACETVFESEAPSKCRIVVDELDTLPLVQANPSHVEAAFAALLAAILHMAASDAIYLTAQTEDGSAIVSIGQSIESICAHSDEKLSLGAIFEMQRNAGLSLALLFFWRLIQGYGGMVWAARNGVSQKPCIRFSLPIATSERGQK